MPTVRNLTIDSIPKIFSLEHEDGTLKVQDLGGYQKYLFLLLDDFHIYDISINQLNSGYIDRGLYYEELLFDKYMDRNGNMYLEDNKYTRLITKCGKFPKHIFSKYSMDDKLFRIFGLSLDINSQPTKVKYLHRRKQYG